MKEEALFIPHCDNPRCELGTFEFTCPSCKKYIVDYKVWWEQDEIYQGQPHNFNCVKCSRGLIVEYDKNEYEYYVRTQ